MAPRLRRAVLAAALVWAAPPVPAHAAVCATATVYVAGAPTTSGPHCQPLLDEVPPRCLTPGAGAEGYGAAAAVCVGP